MKGYIQDDKNTLYMSRQDANKTLKHLKYQGFLGNIIEIYPHFTTFDNDAINSNRPKLEFEKRKIERAT